MPGLRLSNVGVPIEMPLVSGASRKPDFIFVAVKAMLQNVSTVVWS